MWEFLTQLAGNQIAQSLGGTMDDWKSLWEKMQKDPSLFAGATKDDGTSDPSAASQFMTMMNRAGNPMYRPGAPMTPAPMPGGTSLGFPNMFR